MAIPLERTGGGAEEADTNPPALVHGAVPNALPEELFRLVVENSQDLISITDPEGRLIYASPSHEAVIGYTPAELIGRSALELIHPDDVETATEAIREGLLEGKTFRSEIRVKHKDGRWVTVEGAGTAIHDEHGNPAMLQATMRDITERKRAEKEMAFLAYHDKLTGLPNRAMFEELAEMAIARARRQDLAVVVLYIDLDNFKMVNDSLGHAAGDELLRQVAERLQEVSRETDVVTRLAGDEFLLLLTDLQRNVDGSPVGADNAALIAETVATRTHEALSERFVLGDSEFYISASIGISVFPLDAEDGRTLVKNADAAMYRSKNAGPGGYKLYPLDSRESTSKLSVVTRLRQSVTDQRFVLHYQPIVDLVRRDMIGVEALVRWQDPERGLVPPNEFIPLAEEMGLIGPIGDFVIEELFRQWRLWRDNGMEFIVSFNLSPRQLWHPGLVEKLLERLDVWRMDPTSVLVEITESTAMTDPDRTQRILSGLRERGIRIAIDDFGTGYSSLSRLRDLAVDVLKVDRSFVHDVPRDREAATMVKGIVQLSHSLNMAPLAEGIETEEQCRFLVGQGCLLGQGHYFSAPAPADEMQEMWRQSFRLKARPTSW
ncbi:MAG TPA: EAL domain-containing protein [Actinomycetota bacterium]|nr:EAL domain-containing protein [Actinomycetota bacterium]